MLANEIQILQQMAFLAVQIVPELTLVTRPMSWPEARHFCLRHYVDLAVLSSLEQYQTLFNVTAATSAMLWVGLRLQSGANEWRWVSGEELSYDRWFRRNHLCCCASFDTLLEDERMLLSRYCNEFHMFVCQGPLPPHQVTMDSVSSSVRVNLSWRITAFMRMTSHTYNVTWCSKACKTMLFPYNNDGGNSGAAFMNISIHCLSKATPTSIYISSSVVRNNSLTGRNTTLHSHAIVLQVRAVGDPGVQSNLIIIILKSLTPLCLSLLLWILYCFLKKYIFIMEPREMKLSTGETEVQLMVPDNQRLLVLHQTPAAA